MWLLRGDVFIYVIYVGKRFFEKNMRVKRGF